MLKDKRVSVLLMVLALSGAGCGRSYVGTYTGAVTPSLNGVQSQSVQGTMTVAQTTGDSVSINLSAPNTSVGTLQLMGTATVNGQGWVNLMLNSTGSMTSSTIYSNPYTVTTGYNPYLTGTSTNCQYASNLITVDPYYLASGVLNLISSPTTGCPTSITISMKRY